MGEVEESRTGFSEGLLAIIVTALVIREGGTIVVSEEDWKQAAFDRSSLWVFRAEDEGDIRVTLIRSPGRA